MEKRGRRFEYIIGNPRLVVRKEVEDFAHEQNYDVLMLDDDDRSIRFQVLDSHDAALGKEEHEKFLQKLLLLSEIVTKESARIVEWPEGQINIEIDFVRN